MIKIAVFGVNFDNKGSEAMLISLNEFLKNYLGKDFKLLIIYDSNLDKNHKINDNFHLLQGPTTFFHHLFFLINSILNYWFYFVPITSNMHKIVKEFNKCSVSVDLSGFALTDDFSKNSGTRRSLIFLFQTLASKLTMKKHIILPQAIGPFKRKLNERIVKLIIRLSDKVYNRGEYKFKLTKKLKLKCTKTTDIVFEESFINRFKKPSILKEKNQALLNPNARIYHKTLISENYINDQVLLIKTLLDNGYEVLLTPNEIRENEFDDLKICKILKDKFNHESRVHLNTNIEIDNLLDLILESKFIVTSRFHLMVFSLILKKPPIVISWSDKYNDIMSLFNISRYCVESTEKSIDAITDLLANYDKVKNDIKNNLGVNSKKIKASLTEFLKFLN
tara:strand:- start:8679 stop:9854 length:1176 start_codon:yes stop_codon:yes gene_type:complete